MQPQWPEFTDRFLADVAAGFAKRRKAISYGTGFDYDYSPIGEKPEWFSLWGDLYSRRLVTVVFEERNVVHLRIESTWKRDRGKVLLKLENKRLVNDPKRIVDAFEQTLSKVLVDPAPEEFSQPVRDLWNPIIVTVF